MTPVDPPIRFRMYAQREKSGEVLDTFLVVAADSLAIWEQVDGAAPMPISVGLLQAVFARYGKPLEVGLKITPLLAREDADDLPLQLELQAGTSATLQRFRFMPYGWVYPEDYLLWSVGSEEPLAAPAPLVISATTALAKAAQKK